MLLGSGVLTNLLSFRKISSREATVTLIILINQCYRFFLGVPSFQLRSVVRNIWERMEAENLESSNRIRKEFYVADDDFEESENELERSGERHKEALAMSKEACPKQATKNVQGFLSDEASVSKA